MLAAAAVLARVVWRHLPRAWRIEARVFVGYAEIELKLLVVRLALAHWTRQGCHNGATRPSLSQTPSQAPSPPPPGFRRGRHGLSLQREAMRVVRLSSRGGGVRCRIAAMQTVLRTLRRWIARVHKRLATIRLGPGLVAVRPAAAILIACATAPVTGADTS